MKFSQKLFLGIFFTSSSLAVVSSLSTFYSLSGRVTQSYLKRYLSVNRSVSDTFHELDRTTSILNRNAVRVLYEIDKQKGLLENQELTEIRKSLSVWAAYVFDNQGRFLRFADPLKYAPTASSPAEPGFSLFQLCDRYRNLVAKNGSTFEQTPILPNLVTGIPLRWVMIPNHDRTRILETAIHLDFIGEILKKVAQGDPNILRIGIFTPKGAALGIFDPGKTQSKGDFMDPIPGAAKVQSSTNGSWFFRDNRLHIFSDVAAESQECCECTTKKLTAENETYHYVLESVISTDEMQHALADLSHVTLGICLFALGLAFLLSRALARRLVSKFEMIESGITHIVQSGNLELRLNAGNSNAPGRPSDDEFASLARNFDRMLESLASSQQRLLTSERDRAFGKAASQVAHDIRSPLAALRVILFDLPLLPEDSRNLVKLSVARINDIANQLLVQSRDFLSPAPPLDSGGSGTPPDPRRPQHLAGLLEALTSEKRVQFRSRLEVEIEFSPNSASYGLFSQVDPIELQRIVSNLVNNAVEAIPGRGQVSLTLTRQEELNLITVKDNGRGIPAEVIQHLGKAGFSFSKEQGYGYGLHHAKTTVEAWGGKLSILSQVGKGTTVELTIPRVDPPRWFLAVLAILPGSSVIALDDDRSIHEVWKRRLDEWPASAGDRPALLLFSDPDSLLAWSKNADLGDSRSIFLFDYELTHGGISGLDLLERLNVCDRGYLVTSHYDEESLQRRCIRLGVRLIPKSNAGFVPITPKKKE